MLQGVPVQEWTVHGGRLAAACARFGGAPGDWIDLSTGINPHGWPAEQVGEIDWRALPDEQALAELEAAAADHFGVAAEHVCALPGSEIGLRLLGMLPLAGDPVHVEPTYRSHGESTRGSVAIAADAIGDAVQKGRRLLLANPNNPDGRIVPRTVLIDAAWHMAGHGGWMIVDEAFADVTPAESVTPDVRDDVPLLVLRSFGKFFGLAGVRLGFAIGPSMTIAQIRHRLGSWPVCAAAIAIGTAAYRDSDWIAATRETIAADAVSLDRVLADHGMTAIGDCPLFRLVETDDAAALFERLARQRILSRPFEGEPRWLRFGLPGSATALDRLDRALAGRDG